MESIMINGILVGVCLGLTFVAILCAAFAGIALAIVVGFKNSTHRIEYVDPRNPFAEDDSEEEEDFKPFQTPPKGETPVEAIKREKQQAKEEKLLKEALIGDDEI